MKHTVSYVTTIKTKMEIESENKNISTKLKWVAVLLFPVFVATIFLT